MDKKTHSSENSTIIALEEKLSFQQRQLDQLNSVMLEQQAELQRLRREHDRLAEVVREWFSHNGESLPQERPPHY